MVISVDVYEGKVKKIIFFDDGKVIMEFKDDVIVFNGEKKV